MITKYPRTNRRVSPNREPEITNNYCPRRGGGLRRQLWTLTSLEYITLSHAAQTPRPRALNASTTIQCHKHLILINNQQLSPTSNTTRFIKYNQVEK